MSHTCHAVGCNAKCKPEYLMCPRHWRKVPLTLKNAVNRHYRRGQCDDKRPSAEWLEAAKAAIAQVAAFEGKKVPKPTQLTLL